MTVFFSPPVSDSDSYLDEQFTGWSWGYGKRGLAIDNLLVKGNRHCSD